ncbi:PorT family protein [Hymenobacter sp. 15J16-1T3B]|uniref:porin family protein n=1 Tax=Hymenobacter sp. 15J16-1T3B TaxID=2886941 RepID=UPI001D1136F2|nr:porin family protein [Hymenobacter sp. 15J16-1T3B]MCC3159185.1 PorT family protein [Hymenobacter sp. 15J16-1T3B]
MQHKYFAVLAGLLLTASAAQAQVTFGPRVGLNLSNVAIDTDDANVDTDTQARPGAQLGVAVNVPMGKFALQPALVFSQKGFAAKEKSSGGYISTVESKVRTNYLEVPLNLVYTSGGDKGFQVLAGPYVGFGLSGKVSAKGTWSYRDAFINDSGVVDETHDVKFVNKYPTRNPGDHAFFRSLDAGLNVGVGGKINAFQVQLVYGMGLANIIPDEPVGQDSDDKVRNRGFQLTAGYFFSGN